MGCPPLVGFGRASSSSESSARLFGSSSRTTPFGASARYRDRVSTTQTSPTASQPGIVATGLARSFGTVQAVRDISFEASAGAVTALIGPNGSGKTTLMLMLASLLQPDAGTIRVAGA